MIDWMVRHRRFFRQIFTVSRVGDLYPVCLVLKMIKDKLIIAVIPIACENALSSCQSSFSTKPAGMVKSPKVATKVEQMTNEWSNCMDGHGICPIIHGQ